MKARELQFFIQRKVYVAFKEISYGIAELVAPIPPKTSVSSRASEGFSPVQTFPFSLLARCRGARS